MILPLALILLLQTNAPEKIYRIPSNRLYFAADRKMPKCPQSGVQGNIAYDVLIGRDGKPESVAPLLSLPNTDDSDIRAALALWRWRPIKPKGEPHPVRTITYVAFRVQRLQGKCQLNPVFYYRDPRQVESPAAYVVTDSKKLDAVPKTVKHVETTSEGRLPEGKTASEIEIDTDGTVIRVMPLMEKSSEALLPAALDALWQWRFEPPTRRGEPVRVITVMETSVSYAPYPYVPRR